MPDGSVKPKARLVAQGSTQKEGLDYTTTFAPVAQVEAIRLLFATAALLKLKIVQADIKTAFLNGDLKEMIFMEQPIGYQGGTNRVWRLKKSIYGLKQAPKAWYDKFSSVLRSLNLQSSTADNCIYYRTNPLLLLAIYVDDIILFSVEEKTILDLITSLKLHFELNIIESGKFLGFQYEQYLGGDIFIHQNAYINRILKRFDMEQSNSAQTPIVTGHNNKDSKPFEDNS